MHAAAHHETNRPQTPGHSRIRSVVSVLVIAAVIALSAGLVGMLTASTTQTYAVTGVALSGTEFDAVLEPAELDLGEVQKNTTATGTVRVVNTGRRSITVADITTTCGCTVADRPRTPIPPGHAVDVKVRMNVSAGAGRRTTKHLTFHMRELEERLRLPVSATSAVFLEASPAGLKVAPQDTSLPVTVRSGDGATFRITSATPGSVITGFLPRGAEALETGTGATAAATHELRFDAAAWRNAGSPRSVFLQTDHPKVARLEITVRNQSAAAKTATESEVGSSSSMSSAIDPPVSERLLRTDTRRLNLGTVWAGQSIEREVRLLDVCTPGSVRVTLGDGVDDAEGGAGGSVGGNVGGLVAELVEFRVEEADTVIRLRLMARGPGELIEDGDYADDLWIETDEGRSRVPVRWALRRGGEEHGERVGGSG